MAVKKEAAWITEEGRVTLRAFGCRGGLFSPLLPARLQCARLLRDSSGDSTAERGFFFPRVARPSGSVAWCACCNNLDVAGLTTAEIGNTLRR